MRVRLSKRFARLLDDPTTRHEVTEALHRGGGEVSSGGKRYRIEPVLGSDAREFVRRGYIGDGERGDPPVSPSPRDPAASEEQ